MNIIKDNCLLWCGLKINFTRQKKKLIPLEFGNLELNIAKLLLVEFVFDIFELKHQLVRLAYV